MVLYFIATVFLSATLLFSVQPMVAKTLLPVFGGSSSVWTTCMLFYQTTLLLGYLYAHFVMKRVSRRVQLFGHVAMLIVALGAGYMYDTPTAPPQASTFPVPWLILQLLLVSGLPFFMISSAGPLVQGWFARTGHKRSHDPYFLYAASNAGSFVGLLAYPFVFEPLLGLDTQRAFWLGGFGLFIVLSAGAILMTRKGHHEDPHAPPGDVLASHEAEGEGSTLPITWGRRFRWVFYAFVPSSMLLGVTSHMTMDIASFPLLWVLPLSVYLLTMIVAFAVDSKKLVETIRRPMVMAIMAATILVLATDAQTFAPIVAVVTVQLLVLGLIGLQGHGLLAADRPSAQHLTEFYLIMSIGGALGGLFNGIVAPLVFDTTMEYPITLMCATIMLPWIHIRGLVGKKARHRALFIRYGFAGLSLVYMVLMGRYAASIVHTLGIHPVNEPVVLFALIILVPALMIYFAWKDGLGCTLVLAVPLAVSVYEVYSDPAIQYRERTFYGVLSIADEPIYNPATNSMILVRSLLHGTTNHGVQFLDPDHETEPLGYYHFNGPCGMIMRTIKSMRPEGARIGIMGLGSGAIAVHGREQDEVVFFEIDPAIEEVAMNPEYFTYLQKAPATVSVRLGDGRKLLEESESNNEEKFDLIHADAFSSDSIPVHLLTKEAIELYFDRLTDDGMVVLHISNRYLNLEPLVFELAVETTGIAPFIKDDFEIPEDEIAYHFPSVWVVLTRSPETGQRLLEAGLESYIVPEENRIRIWTDDYSNILSLMRWKSENK